MREHRMGKGGAFPIDDLAGTNLARKGPLGKEFPRRRPQFKEDPISNDALI